VTVGFYDKKVPKHIGKHKRRMLKMKKSLITMLVALVLVAAVGVGATLAYLTDSTDAKINTFKVGDVDIELTETADANGTQAVVTATREGFKFENLQPGDIVNKKPVVTVAADSNSCYVFVKVSEAANLTTDMSATDWVSVGNGVYRYKEVCNAGAELTVFTKVTVDTGIEEGGDLNSITVKAAAIQSANVDIETANTQAAGLLAD